jgi:eukaryotic-like serine/threonine-protein kinase
MIRRRGRRWSTECGADTALRARVAALLAHENTLYRLLPTESFIRPLSIVENIPERIGPYKVVSEIARGGMGAVVKAERDDGVFAQTVAIKLIRADLASARAKARFAEERRILARLSHPGIVRILDGGEQDDRAWLAMDFVDGAPVTEALRRMNAGMAQRLDAFEAVCEAVASAHRALVIHADIKPSNVLMTDDGRVHLLDFGIARLMVGLDADECGDPYPLTKGYAAPERGAGSTPTIASDVFSLGALLLGMMGKVTPHDDGEFVAMTRLPVGQLDGDLAAIAGKALAEKPDDRYADVPELLADLKRHRALLPVHAREPAGWRYYAGRFVLRHRQGVVLTSLAALALAATAVISTVSYIRAETARQAADARFVEMRGMAQFMLTELSEQLSDAPGTVEARVRVAQVSGRYLDRLRRVPDAPLDLRLDSANGYLQLARLQGLSGTANLGRPQDAVHSLDLAQTILDGLDSEAPGVATALGNVALARWSLSADTAGPEWTERALANFSKALGIDPHDDAARLGRLIAEKNVGYDLTTADKPADALATLQRTLAGLRDHDWKPPQEREAALLEVNLLSRIGDATYYAGDKVGSLAPYREGEALIRARLKQAPSQVWEEKLGEARWNIAGTLGDLGRHAEALAVVEKGVADLQRALAFGPDAAIEMRLIVLYGQQSILLDALGRTRTAAAVSQQGVDLRRSRLVAAPDDVTRKRDLAIALAEHGNILSRLKRRDAACAAAREGETLLTRLRGQNALSARDIRIDLPKLRTVAARNCS